MSGRHPRSDVCHSLASWKFLACGQGFDAAECECCLPSAINSCTYTTWQACMHDYTLLSTPCRSRLHTVHGPSLPRWICALLLVCHCDADSFQVSADQRATVPAPEQPAVGAQPAGAVQGSAPGAAAAAAAAEQPQHQPDFHAQQVGTCLDMLSALLSCKFAACMTCMSVSEVRCWFHRALKLPIMSKHVLLHNSNASNFSSSQWQQRCIQCFLQFAISLHTHCLACNLLHHAHR